jgi:hypothetical protein
MAKRKGGTPEADIMDWLARMDFSPEAMSNIWEAHKELARQLEGTGQYPPSAAQLRAVNFAVETVYAPMQEAGVRGALAWRAGGYWEVGYAIKGLRGLYGWERASSIIEARTGTSIQYRPY